MALSRTTNPTVAGSSVFGLEYGNGVPDVRDPVNFNKISHVRWGIQNGNFLEGRYFDKGDVFTLVPEPQCGPVNALKPKKLLNLAKPCKASCSFPAFLDERKAGFFIFRTGLGSGESSLNF